MKYKIYFFLFFLFLMSNIEIMLSQELSYTGPDKDENFFSIGWSEDGTCFAYVWFEKTQAISNRSKIVIVIKDLVKKTVFYTDSKIWDEGNVGEGISAYYPKTADEAWDLIFKENVEYFIEFGIEKGTSSRLLEFPVVVADIDTITIQIEDLVDEPGYGVFAHSSRGAEQYI